MPHLGKNLVIVLALLAAGFFAAWLRFRPHLGTQMSYTDGERTWSSLDSKDIRFAVWDTPKPLPAWVNTREKESRPAISPDGRFLVFAVGEPGLNAELFLAEIVDGEPVQPRPIRALDTAYDELAPAFSNDALYFASNRPGGAGGLDLYRAPYEEGGFGPPERLGPGINTKAHETDPALIPGTRSLVFASNRVRGIRHDFDLYQADLQTDAAGQDRFVVKPFAAVNTPFEERDPAFTADGRTMFFSTDRGGVNGDFDLYRTVRERGAWLAAQVLRGVNTAASERGPLPSADGFSLFFSSGNAGASDLYRARSLELFPIPGKPVGWLDLAVLAMLLLLALLAWLAKRWEQLEIIYKCFLISVLLHLLLLWWFREVYPEGGEMPVNQGRGRVFQVSLAVSNSSASSGGLKARNGQLPATRQSSPEAETPSLAQLGAPELPDAAAPSRGVERAAEVVPETEPSASRAASAAPSQTTTSAAAQVAVQGPQENIARKAGAAPRMVVSARSNLPHVRSQGGGGGAPSRSASSTESFSGTDLPSRNPLIVGGGAPAAQAKAGPARVTPSRFGKEAPSSSSVAVEGPSESLAPRKGSAPGMALEAQGSPAPSHRVADNPARATGFASGLPSVAAPPARPLGTGGSSSNPEEESSIAAAALQPMKPTGAGTPSVALNDQPALPAPRKGGKAPVADGTSLLEPGPSSSRPSEEARERGPARLGPSAGKPPSLGTETGGPPRRGLAVAREDAEGGVPAPSSAGVPEPALETGPLPSVALKGPTEEPAPSRSAGTQPAGEGEHALALAPRGDLRPSPSIQPGGGPRRWTRPGAEGAQEPEPGFRALARGASQEPVPVIQEPSKFDRTPYRNRFGKEKEQALRLHGGGAETERAVTAGLVYLAGLQTRQGNWGDTNDFDEKYGHVLVGKTALCLLAFLGAGHTPDSGTKYSNVTRRAVNFLLAVQDKDTGHFGYTAAYSHATATYALAECYALTKDPGLRQPLQRAVDEILRNQQHSEDPRFDGGWSYYYPDGRIYDQWPRVSVSSWQVMALESARLGGLRVPLKAFEDARRFLLKSIDQQHGWFRYNHDPERLSSAYPTLPASTPAGLFALSLVGEDLDSDQWKRERDFILARAPRRYRFSGDDDFVFRASGNLYFWYYSTLAMFRAGGDGWERWNEQMKRTLLPSQDGNGSWKPISIYSRYAGDDNEDRSYSTAMCVLTLEIYYRYFTPLLKVD